MNATQTTKKGSKKQNAKKDAMQGMGFKAESKGFGDALFEDTDFIEAELEFAATAGKFIAGIADD